MTGDIQFQSLDTWTGSGDKFGLSFKQILLMHINRCVVNGSVEFTGGHTKQVIEGGVTQQVYIPDTRETFNNSIKILEVLLLPSFDDEAKAEGGKISKALEDLEKEYKSKLRNVEDRKDYIKKKIDLYFYMFRVLVALSKRLNFFQEEVSRDEMDE